MQTGRHRDRDRFTRHSSSGRQIQTHTTDRQKDGRHREKEVEKANLDSLLGK